MRTPNGQRSNPSPRHVLERMGLIALERGSRYLRHFALFLIVVTAVIGACVIGFGAMASMLIAFCTIWMPWPADHAIQVAIVLGFSLWVGIALLGLYRFYRYAKRIERNHRGYI